MNSPEPTLNGGESHGFDPEATLPVSLTLQAIEALAEALEEFTA